MGISSKTNLLPLSRDLLIILISIIAAVLLGWSGVIYLLIVALSPGWYWLISFFAGFFFVSFFTVAPAGAVLVALGLQAPWWSIAFWGGLGAMLGDWLIFRFIRDHFSRHLLAAFGRRPIKINHGNRLWRWFLILCGALIVASPFPDEIGLTLMGFGQLPTRYFLPLSFILNSGGLALIVSVINLAA